MSPPTFRFSKSTFLDAFQQVLLVGWILCVIACDRPPIPTPQPHIVFISLDTMRQDHLGTYNPSLTWLTPELDQFAEEAVVFERAYAPVPFTLPSHLSMLTGVYPDVHGVDSQEEKLSAKLHTLPEALQKAGYHNLGLVSNNWMDPDFGFGRGFARYERVDYDLTYSDRINQELELWLNERSPIEAESPQFLFLHYTDAHSDFYNVKRNLLPYYAPEEDLQALGVSGDPSRFCDGEERCATAFLIEQNPTKDREALPLPSETLDELLRLYRAGIRYMDRDLGKLFALLRERDLWNDALIIITADHGEEFREHGEFLHRQPYRENLSVPLMIKFPQGQWAGRRHREVVETVDLMPTILEWLALPSDIPLQGRSLLPLIERTTRAKDLAFGRDKFERRFSLRSPEWTLIHDLTSGRSELYDAKQDPAESQDQQAQRPEEVRELLKVLERIVSINERLARTYSGETGQSLLTPEEQKELRALGYLQ